MGVIRNFPRMQALLLLLWCTAHFMHAQDLRYGIVERTGETLPADVYLLNEDSVWMRFGDLVKKPTLLSFVYYRCPGLCSPVMSGIAEIIDKSDLKPGRDYQVITISVDYKENIALAREKKKNYLRSMHKSWVSPYWQFYVTDSATVKKLTDAAGWQFKRTGNDFVHVAATVLISPQRKISQYFYGTFILPMHFQMAVHDAARGLADASRLEDQKYCFNFKPAKNKYYSMVVSYSGIGILVAAVFLFIWLSLGKTQENISNQPDEDGPIPIR